MTSIDKYGLVEACRRFDAVAQLVLAVGDFVPRGAPLLRIYPADGRESPGFIADRMMIEVTLIDCAM